MILMGLQRLYRRLSYLTSREQDFRPGMQSLIPSGWSAPQNIMRKKNNVIDQGRSFANSIECFSVGINSNPALIADDVIHIKFLM